MENKQYVVMHMEKRREISSVLERHITRTDVKYVNGERVEETWVPDNTDSDRAHLNRELVSRVTIDEKTGNKKTLTIQQAVRKRIGDAGIKTILGNQNTSLEVILSGSPETMNGLTAEKVDEWAERSMEWAKNTWGDENIVSAALHLDEKTPHIHLIVVPIVTGLSRRTKARDEERRRAGKTVKTRRRNVAENRLCANEVFTKPRLYSYHTSYAEEVGKLYGLERGLMAEPGSRKRHQTSEEYNRELARWEQERRRLIAELTSEYSDLKARTEEEKEKSNKVKKEADDLEAQLMDIRTAVKTEEDFQASLLEKGRVIEGQVSKRESYLQSLTSLNLWDSIMRIPEYIRQELNRMVGRYFDVEVVSFKEEVLTLKNGGKDKFLRMEVKVKNNGKIYNLDVQESDGKVWRNEEICTYKNGNPLVMREIADYCSRTLTTEAKALVASLYKQPEQAPVAKDPVIDILKKRFGEISVDSVAALKTNGTETGRMYHFTVGGKKRTAVWDYEAKEVCTCAGHAKKGAFYLETWVTFNGKPAIAVNNRVYSEEYKRKLRGPSF